MRHSELIHLISLNDQILNASFLKPWRVATSATRNIVGMEKILSIGKDVTVAQ
jgi:hypothetical protein